MMSRQALQDKSALERHYIFAFKSLVMVALPIAVITTAIAPALIGILGGPEFLPDGGLALQLMIWSIPIGWINSLTQYVLIALNRQRQITRAFIVAVSFNIIGNLIFLPTYSFRAAAMTTILSEAVLLIGFYWLLRRDLQEVHYGRVLWKPALAASLMAGALLLLWPLQPVIALLVSLGVYTVGLAWLFPFSPQEAERLRRFWPFQKAIPIAEIKN
jgi:O-antigen/teichoic acid export membrane protein